MNKRDLLARCATAATAASAAAAGLLSSPAQAAKAKTGPTLLTVGGLLGRANRAALDPVLEQMMGKHGVKFSQALALDAAALNALPQVTITPTLEYDAKPHRLSGPLLTTVLASAGVNLNANLLIGLRAVDGYNVAIKLDDVKTYQMLVATHLDGQPMGLGGLGPQWAVYDADRLPAFKDKPLKDRFALCPWGLYYIDVAAL